MTLNVVTLPKRTVDASVISHIENLLADAKSGDLEQVAIISFNCDGCMSEFMNLGRNSYEMLAALHILSNRLNQSIQDFDE